MPRSWSAACPGSKCHIHQSSRSRAGGRQSTRCQRHSACLSRSRRIPRHRQWSARGAAARAAGEPGPISRYCQERSHPAPLGDKPPGSPPAMTEVPRQRNARPGNRSRPSCRPESRPSVQSTPNRRLCAGVGTVERGQSLTRGLGQDLAQAHLNGGGLGRRMCRVHSSSDQIVIKVQSRTHAYDFTNPICMCKAYAIPWCSRPISSFLRLCGLPSHLCVLGGGWPSS